MENNHNPMEDDGSLDFLKIPADETKRSCANPSSRISAAWPRV